MVGPHMETLLQATETGQRIVRDISVLCSRIPRPDPLPKNLSDLLIKQDNLHEKKKAIALGEKPAVAKVTSAARKQAELRLKKRENMTAEEIKKWDELGAAVKTFKQAQGKGSKSVGNSSININPAKQPTPPRSMRGGHEMSSNSAATSKENCPEKQNTPSRRMPISSLHISPNPQSTSQNLYTNNAGSIIGGRHETSSSSAASSKDNSPEKGSKSVGNSSINISPTNQHTPPRSMRGGHEMSSSSAATSKEKCPGKQHTPSSRMPISPLHISPNPQSASQNWYTNNAGSIIGGRHETSSSSAASCKDNSAESMRGGHEMSSSSAATTKENCPEKQNTPSRRMPIYPLHISPLHSTSQNWPTNNDRSIIGGPHETSSSSAESCKENSQQKQHITPPRIMTLQISSNPQSAAQVSPTNNAMSIGGGPNEMISSSAASFKENSREKQHTLPRMVPISPLQISSNPQSTSQNWPKNNAKVTAIPGVPNNYKVALTKEQHTLLNQLSPEKSENASAAKENSNDATVPEGDQVQPTKIPLDRASRPKKPPAKLASSTAEVKSGRKYVAKNQCGNCIYKKLPKLEKWVQCGHCKQWYHFYCVKLKDSQVPKTAILFLALGSSCHP
ncbi:hypothetical protein OUZ56_029167 [Daphnia magna]|uniref:Zinc finger PHD-type domain-containing protein n=1 Tax=Daphnia magna TaxID=35525 RepID=A0ABR0B6H6_9CRUS|nr:hypothetical protein OUZ56_029167 [Daphnia magna]